MNLIKLLVPAQAHGVPKTVAVLQREELVAERALRLLLEAEIRDLRAQLEAARALDRTQGAPDDVRM